MFSSLVDSLRRMTIRPGDAMDAQPVQHGISPSERAKKAWVTRHANGERAQPEEPDSAGERRTMQLVQRDGFVSFSKPEAVKAFMATHKGDKWGGQRQSDGSVRFYPLGGEYHRKVTSSPTTTETTAKPGVSPHVSEHSHTPEQLKNAIARAPMIGGQGSKEGGLRRSSLTNHSLGRVLERNGGRLPVGTRFVDKHGNVGAYLGHHTAPNGAVMHTVKMADGKTHSGYAFGMPEMYLAREVGRYL